MDIELITEIFNRNMGRLVKEASAAHRRADRGVPRHPAATARSMHRTALRRMPP